MADKAYQNMLKNVLERGQECSDRTGTGTLALFGHQERFDLTEGFPLLTTKKLHFKSIAYELLWFLRGDTNIKFLKDHGVSIWDEWADEKGNLGRVYGAQWRDWRTSSGESIDQISRLIEGLKKDPFSRRHLVVAYNPGEVDGMALPPCHAFFQFHVSRDGGLSCQLYQRSADLFLGVPFNIASYALLTEMIAHVTDLKPREFIHTFGNLHLYKDHLEQARLQLTRQPRALPKLNIRGRHRSIFDIVYEDLELFDYYPHPPIKGKVSV